MGASLIGPMPLLACIRSFNVSTLPVVDACALCVLNAVPQFQSPDLEIRGRLCGNTSLCDDCFELWDMEGLSSSLHAASIHRGQIHRQSNPKVRNRIVVWLLMVHFAPNMNRKRAF